jgi:glycosyltransferase involved in cell wall biosynthesis
MKRIKILHIYKRFYPKSYGGVELFIEDLIQGLSKYKNIENIVLCHNKKKNFINKRIKKNLKIFSIKENFQLFRTPISFSFIKYFFKIYKEVDIIHFNYPYPFADIFAFFIKKKIVTTYHSDIVRQKFAYLIYKTVFFEKLLKVSSIIICSSKNYIKSSRTLYKFKKKVISIPFGIDKVKQTLKNKPKEKYFLFIGNNRYYKNLDLLIDVSIKTNFNLKIVTNKSKKNTLLSKRLKNNKNIRFFFDVSNKKKQNLLLGCLCLVLPSHLRSEAFGYSLLEGLSYGKPLISCDIRTGTSYINKNNLTGYVVKPNNFKSLQIAMKKMYDKKITKKFSINSLKRFDDLFIKKKMVENYIKVYQEVLNANN